MPNKRGADLKHLKNAWLSPTGKLVTDVKYYPYLLSEYYSWHETIACAVICDEQGLKSYRAADSWVNNLKPGYSATEYLEDKKWIRLHGFCGRDPIWIIDVGQRLTKAQERVIVDWCEANDQQYDKAFSE